jgi:Smg protein
MKQNVVDVLMFLFENYIGDDSDDDEEDGVRDLVQIRLEELGFPQMAITKAFDWLEDLAILQDLNGNPPLTSTATRVLSEEETLLLDVSCQGFLLQLEQSGILTPITRELVLDRVFALDTQVDLEQLKWLVMIVLFNHPGEENAYAWMESLVFDQILDYIH